MSENPSSDVGLDTGRDKAGRFARGNTVALVTGARSRQFWDAAAAERERLRDAAIADRGFSPADVPATVEALCDGLAQARLIRDGCFLRLLSLGGPLTQTDRRRDVLEAWGSAADKALRHATALGLERVQRDGGSLQDWLDRQPAPAGEKD